MELNDETKVKIDKLPIVLRTAVNYLLDVIDNIINGKCDEETLTSTMATINNNSKGRIGKEDVVNYDKAAKMLGFSVTNRASLKLLLDKNGIHQVVINNMKCGFLRSDIMALKDKLNEEVRKRELKNERKAQRNRIKNYKKDEKLKAKSLKKLFGN